MPFLILSTLIPMVIVNVLSKVIPTLIANVLTNVNPNVILAVTKGLIKYLIVLSVFLLFAPSFGYPFGISKLFRKTISNYSVSYSAGVN
jgi:uncharacterized protein YqhQ